MAYIDVTAVGADAEDRARSRRFYRGHGRSHDRLIRLNHREPVLGSTPTFGPLRVTDLFTSTFSG